MLADRSVVGCPPLPLALAAARRAARGHLRLAVPTRAGPEGGDGVDGRGDLVGRALVVDPPADEVGPGVGRLAGDLEAALVHPADRLEELLVGERDPGLRARFLGPLAA